MEPKTRGRKRHPSEHDGWLGEPFASDFGASFGVILIEDIYDGSAHNTLGEAVKAARALDMRYVAFAPARPVVIAGRTIWTTFGAPYKLYVRRGNSGLDIYSYLRHRAAETDKEFMRYHLLRADDPAAKARAKAGNQRWRDKVRDTPEYKAMIVANNARAVERRRNDDDLREDYNDYHRAYMKTYFQNNPEQLEKKRMYDRLYNRKSRNAARKKKDET